MSDHIRFQETWLGLVPLLKGANGDLLFEQGSGTRRRKTTLTVCSRPTQEAIGSRGTHGEELAAARVRQMKVSLPFQRLNVGLEIRHEPFRTDLIGFLPDEKQGALDLWSERSLSPTSRKWPYFLWVIEQPHGITTSVPCCGGNLIK